MSTASGAPEGPPGTTSRISWLPPALRKDGLAVTALLALFAVSAFLSLVGDSVTSDESAHLSAGYTYVDRGDFRLNPEHPSLAKAWAALPLRLLRLRSPDYGSRAWRVADQWHFGFEFLHGRHADGTPVDPMRLLIPARSAMLALGLALGLAVYGAAREFLGRRAALIALFLYSLCPTMLAHSRLVTTDLPASLGYFGTVWAFLRFTRRPGAARAVVLGAALGLALLMKYSMVLLVPVLAVLAALHLLEPGLDPRARRDRARGLFMGAVTAGLVAWLCVWAGYGFRYSASPDPDASISWGRDRVGGAVGLARSLHLLPEAYLLGFRHVSQGLVREAFLNGVIGDGWWYYFPEAFLIKTTPCLILLVLWTVWRSVSTAARVPRAWTTEDWCLALPPVAYFAAAMSSGMNIGHRHIAPVYPFLIVLAARTANAGIDGPRATRAIVAALLCSHAVSSLTSFPGYLSYFNLAAGGARGGSRYLVDSNIDWGQDMIRLGRLMRERGIDELQLLACLENGDPHAYGVLARHRVDPFTDRPLPESVFPKPGQYFAISLTILQGMYNDNKSFQEFLARTRAMTPIGVAGDSINLYRMPAAGNP